MRHDSKSVLGRKLRARLEWKELRNTRGVRTKIARKLKIARQSVDKWLHVPPEHVFKVEALTGVSAEKLRPDIFWNDPLRKNNLAHNL